MSKYKAIFKIFPLLLLCAAIFSAPANALQSAMEPINEVFEPAGNYDFDHFAKVAVIQWNPHGNTPVGPGVTAEQGEVWKQSNREALAQYVRAAAQKGAEWIITSEFGIDGYPDIPGLPPEEDDYRNRDDIRPYVEKIPGPSTDYFGKLAIELGVTIHIDFAEVDPVTDAYYNTTVAIGPKGQILATYRKINLYGLEKNFLSAGTLPVTYDSPYGKVGLLICADVNSANPLNSLKAAGVEILALSTSWAEMNTGFGVFTNTARAMNAYVLAANQNYFPDSGVIQPNGAAQSHIRQSEGIAYGYVPRKATRPYP